MSCSLGRISFCWLGCVVLTAAWVECHGLDQRSACERKALAFVGVFVDWSWLVIA